MEMPPKSLFLTYNTVLLHKSPSQAAESGVREPVSVVPLQKAGGRQAPVAEAGRCIPAP